MAEGESHLNLLSKCAEERSQSVPFMSEFSEQDIQSARTEA